jgi:hypothetical protein
VRPPRDVSAAAVLPAIEGSAKQESHCDAVLPSLPAAAHFTDQVPTPHKEAPTTTSTVAVPVPHSASNGCPSSSSSSSCPPPSPKRGGAGGAALPTAAATGEAVPAERETTPGTSFNSASSPPPSDGSAGQLSKYALWKAKQEAQRKAAESATTTTLPPPPPAPAAPLSDEDAHPSMDDRAPPFSRALVTPCVVEDLANVHVSAGSGSGTAASVPPSAALPTDTPSTLASTIHTVVGSQSVGGTEAERTPVERSVRGLHSGSSDGEMGEGEGAKVPLSHAPTPLLPRSPLRHTTASPPEKAAAVHGGNEEAAVAIVSELPSRAFSRSDASTRSLSNAVAAAEMAAVVHATERGRAESAATPTHWTTGRRKEEAEGASPEPACVGFCSTKSLDGAHGVAAVATAAVKEGIPAAAASSQEGSAGDSPPASADVTMAQGTVHQNASRSSASLSSGEAPVERDLRVAVEDVAAATDGSHSPDRCHSEQTSERVMTVATSQGLFSRNSSSFASTPVLYSNSLSASVARMDGGTPAAALQPWSSEKKAGESSVDDRGNAGGSSEESEEENVCRDEEVGGAVGQPQEPVRQRAPVPHGVANAAPVVTAPPRASQAAPTAGDEDAVLSPYRPGSPVPCDGLGAAPSLTSDSNAWSGCPSPERVWELPALISPAPSVVEEGLEVFRRNAASPPTVPLTRVQYVHQDL